MLFIVLLNIYVLPSRLSLRPIHMPKKNEQCIEKQQGHLDAETPEPDVLSHLKSMQPSNKGKAVVDKKQASAAPAAKKPAAQPAMKKPAPPCKGQTEDKAKKEESKPAPAALSSPAKKEEGKSTPGSSTKKDDAQKPAPATKNDRPVAAKGKVAAPSEDRKPPPEDNAPKDKKETEKSNNISPAPAPVSGKKRKETPPPEDNESPAKKACNTLSQGALPGSLVKKQHPQPGTPVKKQQQPPQGNGTGSLGSSTRPTLCKRVKNTVVGVIVPMGRVQRKCMEQGEPFYKMETVLLPKKTSFVFTEEHALRKIVSRLFKDCPALVQQEDREGFLVKVLGLMEEVEQQQRMQDLMGIE